MDTVQIFIRRPGHSSKRQVIQLPIDADDTVGSIREKVSQKMGLYSGSMKIIFCGKKLNDETLLKMLNLGPSTCLTVTTVDELPELRDEVTDLVKDYVMVNDAEKPEFQPKTNSFFVFCKQCQKLSAAKLRAYCAKCQSSSIEFLSEPANWEDIRSGKISVNCESCAEQATADFVFKCIDCSSEGAVLNQIKLNVSENECLICGEVEPIVLTLDCAHTACVPCFSAYLEQVSNQWLFVYKEDVGFTMRCIMLDCESYVKDPHHFYLMGAENYKKFQRTAAEKYLLIQEGYHYCPFENCGASFIIGDISEEGADESNNALCPECQRLFCLKCKSRAGCICNAIDKSNDLIKFISKPCPSCKAPTEKSGGCSHMRCTNCTHEWCYICGKTWSEDCQWAHWFE